MEFWVLFEPAYLIRLKERGRIAFAPGPGAVLADEPPLPRLERAVGALAELLLYEKKLEEAWGSMCKDCESYEECVLSKLGVQKITGPFLVISGKENHVYLVKGKKLVKIENVGELFETEERESESFLDFVKVEESKEEHDMREFAFSEVHVSLAPLQKATAEGHLFSLTAYDYWALGGKPYVAYWIEIEEPPKGVGALGSMRPLGRFLALPSKVELSLSGKPYYAVSAVPVTEGKALRVEGLDQLGPTYDACVDGKRRKRRELVPAFAEGSLLEQYSPGRLYRALDEEQLSDLIKELKTLTLS